MKSWIKILIGLVSGLAVGLIFGKEFNLFPQIQSFIFPFLHVCGKVFIDLLKMLVGILVFSSIVTGICHINDPKKLERIGVRTLLFYAGTTLVAVLMAIGFSFVFQTGKGLNLKGAIPTVQTSLNDNVLEFFSNLIPSNPIAAFAQGNILQIIVFGVFFAYAIILTCNKGQQEKGNKILSFLESLSEVMYTLTHFIMRFAPYGVFALIATSVGDIGLRVVLPLLKFLAHNYICCILQIFVVFSLCIKFIAKLEVMPFFKGMKDAAVVALSTSSSSATLPVSLECAREHLGVSEDISGFVLSLGSTVNMNGAAIGQVASAFFIADAYGIVLSPLNIGVLVVMSMLSAVGAAGIPGTGVVMLSMVLQSMGLPLEGIVLVAAVDRLREMMSTVVNVLGDGVASIVVARKEDQMNEKLYHHSTWTGYEDTYEKRSSFT